MMNTILKAYWYVNRTWQELDFTDRSVQDLIDGAYVIYIQVEDPQGGKHNLTRDDLLKMDASATADLAIRQYVPSLETTDIELKVVETEYRELNDVDIYDGVAFTLTPCPFVFNYSGAYECVKLNQRYFASGLMTDINLSNDVAVGYVKGMEDFVRKPLHELDSDELEAAVLLIGKTVTKASDFFDTTGNSVRVRTNASVALQALLTEAKLYPADFGIVGGYGMHALKSKQVHGRIVSSPYLVAFVHPNKVPVELRRSRVSKEYPISTKNVIFRGNKPSTARALGNLFSKTLETSVVSGQGTIRSMEENPTFWEWCLAYPQLPAQSNE